MTVGYLDNVVGRVVYRLSNGLGYHEPCESLYGFWETGTHSRARSGCHVLTFSGRGVIVVLYFNFFNILSHKNFLLNFHMK